MRRILLLLLSTGLLHGYGYAQDPYRTHHLGVHESFTDYNVVLLDGKVFALDSSLSHTTRLSYTWQPNHNWLISGGVSHGFILNQTFEQQHFNKVTVNGADVMLMLKLNNGWLMPQDARIAPYLGFGYRVDHVSELSNLGRSPYLLHNQYAAGTHISLTSRTYLQLQAAVDQKLVGDFNTHMQYRIGIVQSLGAMKEGHHPFEEVVSDQGQRSNDSLRLAMEHMEGLVAEQELLIDSLSGLLVDMEDAEMPIVQEDASQQGEVTEDSSTPTEQMPEDEEQTEENVVIASTQEPTETRSTEEESSQEPVPTEVSMAEPPTPQESETTVSDQNDIDAHAILVSDAPHGFYAIVVSVKDKGIAQLNMQRLQTQFENVYVLKQPNGFYRVGVFAGELAVAKKVREELLANGYASVWVVKE